MPGGRGKDTAVNQPTPAAAFQPQTLNGPGSPYMKRGPREPKNQVSSQESGKLNEVGTFLCILLKSHRRTEEAEVQYNAFTAILIR